MFTAPSDADRRAALATLTAAGPAVRIPLPGGQGWLITGYAHVRDVLTHPHVGKRAGLLGGPFVDDLPPGVAADLFQQMLNRNPPDYGRLRRLVASACPSPLGRPHHTPPASSHPVSDCRICCGGCDGRRSRVTARQGCTATSRLRRLCRSCADRPAPIRAR